MKLVIILTLLTLTTHAQTVSLSIYGAIGNNGQDEGAQIQAALNSGNTVIQGVAGRTYLSARTLTIPEGVTFDLNGATLNPHANLPQTASALLQTTSVTTHNNSASIVVTAGSKTFTYSNASQLAPGEIVVLGGADYSQYGGDGPYKQGWFSAVDYITGNLVTLKDAAPESFTASSIKQMKGKKNVHIKNGTLNFSGRTGGYGISFSYAQNSSIENVTLTGGGKLEIGMLITAAYSAVKNCTITGIQTSNTQTGYGVNIQGVRDTVTYNTITGARHCITSAGRSYFSPQMYFCNNTVSSAGGISAAIDLHGNASGEIRNNNITSVSPASIGISIRHSHTWATGNTITYNNTSGITFRAFYLFENAIDDIHVDNNQVSVSGSGGYVYFVTNSAGQGAPLTNSTFNGNTVYGPRANFVTAKLGSGNQMLNNTFYSTDNYTPSISPTSNAGLTLSGNTFNGIGTPPVVDTIPDPTPEPIGGECFFIRLK